MGSDLIIFAYCGRVLSSPGSAPSLHFELWASYVSSKTAAVWDTFFSTTTHLSCLAVWQAHACFCVGFIQQPHTRTAVNPPTGGQMGLAYMRKSQFRSVQLTSKLRADGLKSRFSLWTPDPASQGKVSTVRYTGQNVCHNEGVEVAARVTVINLQFYVTVTKSQLKEHKRIGIWS